MRKKSTALDQNYQDSSSLDLKQNSSETHDTTIKYVQLLAFDTDKTLLREWLKMYLEEELFKISDKRQQVELYEISDDQVERLEELFWNAYSSDKFHQFIIQSFNASALPSRIVNTINTRLGLECINSLKAFDYYPDGYLEISLNLETTAKALSGYIESHFESFQEDVVFIMYCGKTEECLEKIALLNVDCISIALSWLTSDLYSEWTEDLAIEVSENLTNNDICNTDSAEYKAYQELYSKLEVANLKLNLTGAEASTLSS